MSQCVVYLQQTDVVSCGALVRMREVSELCLRLLVHSVVCMQAWLVRYGRVV